jgi:Flp pilus assembly protein protease CpaA
MLFEMTMVLLGISVAGFGLAGYWDLKTTEFPDWLPYVMIVLAVGTRGAFSFLMGDFSYVMNSVIIGSLFLAFGLALYWFKQWGDGDAWLLGVLGFVFPDSGSFIVNTILWFPVAMLFNFFFIAFFYLLMYSIALGLRSPAVSRKFIKELKDAKGGMTRIVGGFSIAVVALMGVFSLHFSIPVWDLLYMIIFPPLLFSVLLFTRYGRFVENNLFRKKIPARNIKIGDVLVEDKWRGITEKEASAIRKKGGHVWIKEGIRFAPVFVITVVVTLFWGNLLLLFV